jgi:3-oxoacyl-[acyl-carrier-protein] synthase III
MYVGDMMNTDTGSNICSIKAKILGTGSYLPSRILSNKDLEKMVDTNDEWIVERTGIRERRIIDDSDNCSDLAYRAALKALESSGTSPDELDLIIVATISPDYIFPATACIVQDKLGAKKAAAFDLEAACSGFVYALTVAEKFIISGAYKRVLVIGSEALSRIIDYTDRSTCILFGDGAGAVVLGPSSDGSGILSSDLGSDGSGGSALNIPAGGTRRVASHKTVDERLHYMRMDGKEVFKFAVRVIGKSTGAALEKAGLQYSDISYLIPHQANTRIIDAAAKRLDMSHDRVHSNIDRYANTSAASIPIALDEAVRDGKIKSGDNVVLVGFGGGLTWASSVIRW